MISLFDEDFLAKASKDSGRMRSFLPGALNAGSAASGAGITGARGAGMQAGRDASAALKDINSIRDTIPDGLKEFGINVNVSARSGFDAPDFSNEGFFDGGMGRPPIPELLESKTPWMDRQAFKPGGCVRDLAEGSARGQRAACDDAARMFTQ